MKKEAGIHIGCTANVVFAIFQATQYINVVRHTQEKKATT